jgi:hypothetical protein
VARAAENPEHDQAGLAGAVERRKCPGEGDLGEAARPGKPIPERFPVRSGKR